MPALKLLLIEDDRDDISFLEEALNELNEAIELDVVFDGEQAIPHLLNSQTGPDLIIMDLNLPKVHGRELLRIIKTTNVLKRIPVFILTTSTAKEDIQYCARYGAEKFFTKPNSIEKYVLIVDEILKALTSSHRVNKKNTVR